MATDYAIPGLMTPGTPKFDQQLGFRYGEPFDLVLGRVDAINPKVQFTVEVAEAFGGAAKIWDEPSDQIYRVNDADGSVAWWRVRPDQVDLLPGTYVVTVKRDGVFAFQQTLTIGRTLA